MKVANHRRTSPLAHAVMAVAVAFGAVVVCPGVSLAASESDKKAAMGALALAKNHYEKKRYKEAALLFHQAFRLNPLPAFLFNAARSEQRAFQLNKADKHYDQLLARKDLDARTRDRANFHRREVAELRKRLKEERDKALSQAGHASNVEVKSAAKAAAVPGHKKGADQTGEQRGKVSSSAAKTAKSSSVVKRASAPNGRGSAVVPTEKGGAKTGSVSSPLMRKQLGGDGAWKTPAAIGSLSVSLLSFATGLYLLNDAGSMNAELTAKVAKRDKVTGKIASLSREEFDARVDTIDGQRRSGVIAMGVGAVAAGAGIWMLLTRPSKRSARLEVRPGVRRIALALRF